MFCTKQKKLIFSNIIHSGEVKNMFSACSFPQTGIKAEVPLASLVALRIAIAEIPEGDARGKVTGS